MNHVQEQSLDEVFNEISNLKEIKLNEITLQHHEGVEIIHSDDGKKKLLKVMLSFKSVTIIAFSLSLVGSFATYLLYT